MPHQILAAMFGRRPFPRFRVGLSRNGDGSVAVRLQNVGAGMAVMPLLRLQVIPPRTEPWGLSSTPAMHWQDRRTDITHGTEEPWDLVALLPKEFRLYPGETRIAAHCRLDSYRRTMRIRVDCDHALPFEQEASHRDQRCDHLDRGACAVDR